MSGRSQKEDTDYVLKKIKEKVDLQKYADQAHAEIRDRVKYSDDINAADDFNGDTLPFYRDEDSERSAKKRAIRSLSKKGK